MSGPSISVIILTFNEEANIREAIDSVRGWAKEVFVVDSLSTDATIDRIREIADPGVGVVQHPFESYSQQWNWALKGLPLTGDWTLKLDADERVTPEFKAELSGLLPKLSQDVDGIYFRRRIQIVGGWIESGAVRENYDMRMWRTGGAEFENRPINEHALVKGKTVRVKSFVDHCDAKSLTEWIDKQNRYTSLETLSRLRGDFSGAITPRLFGPCSSSAFDSSRNWDSWTASQAFVTPSSNRSSSMSRT
jgi:glycosyltransferase involved in cell wall biosynthesis